MVTKFKKGNRVILGKHDRGEFWSPSMNEFVGKESILIEEATVDTYNYVVWYVELTGHRYLWRESNMTLAKPLRKYMGECPCGIDSTVCEYHNF